MTRTASLLLAVLLTLGVSACGDDGDDTATDAAPAASSGTAEAPTASADPTPSQEPAPSDGPTIDVQGDGPVPFTEVAVITGTEEDGMASPTPVLLESEEAVDDFVSQFTGPSLAGEVRAAVERAPEAGPDQSLVGAVVTIGCDRPDELRVQRVDGAVQVVALMPKNQVQCFAAQTTVAVLLLDTTKLDPVVS